MSYSSLRLVWAWAAAGILVLGGTATAGFDARVAEVLLTEAGEGDIVFPPYVEVFAPLADQPFDLVVLDANADPNVFRQWHVRAVVTITPDPNIETYVVHEGDWPDAEPPPARRVATDASLRLTEIFDAARALVVFDQVTGFFPGATTEEPVLERRDLGQVLDVVTYSINGVPAEPFLSEPIVPLGSGDHAILRLHDGGDYVDEFLVGSAFVNDRQPVLEHDNGIAIMNPGFTNTHRIAPVPAPGAAAAGCLLLGLIALRRPRRRSPRPLAV